MLVLNLRNHTFSSLCSNPKSLTFGAASLTAWQTSNSHAVLAAGCKVSLSSLALLIVQPRSVLTPKLILLVSGFQVSK